MSEVATDPTSAPAAPVAADGDGVEVGDIVLVAEERHTDRLAHEAHEAEEDEADAAHEAAQDKAEAEARSAGREHKRHRRTRRTNPAPKIIRWFPAIVEVVLDAERIIAHVFKAARGSGSIELTRGDQHGQWRRKGRRAR